MKGLITNYKITALPVYILGVLLFSSCMTTVYYPVHRFVKKEEKTVDKKSVKQGVIEFLVSQKRVISPPPNVIVDYETAKKRGKKEAKKQISQFCAESDGKDSGKYTIQSVSSGTRHSGWKGYTSSYYGTYTGFSSTSISPVYKKYTAMTFRCD